jgi:hypothetical protein
MAAHATLRCEWAFYDLGIVRSKIPTVVMKNTNFKGYNPVWSIEKKMKFRKKTSLQFSRSKRNPSEKSAGSSCQVCAVQMIFPSFLLKVPENVMIKETFFKKRRLVLTDNTALHVR